MDDFQLIQGCIDGDKRCWDTFVEQFSRLIYDSIHRTVRKFGYSFSDHCLCEDLYHDIFILILDNNCKALKLFEGRNGCRLAHYIRTISVRKTIDYLRKQRDEISVDAQDDKRAYYILFQELVDFNTQKIINQKDAADTIEFFLEALQEKERQFCQMIYQKQLAPKEVARQLGITVDHVYVIKQRIIKKMQKFAKEKNII